MSYATRVRAGVALLDEKVPGWHERIDVEMLEMADMDQCIMGQLTGNYFSEESYEIRGYKGFDYGFDEEPSLIPLLNRLWRYVVKQRQAAAA